MQIYFLGPIWSNHVINSAAAGSPCAREPKTRRKTSFRALYCPQPENIFSKFRRKVKKSTRNLTLTLVGGLFEEE